MDLSPRLETEDTAYGFRYAAIRKPNHNPDTEKYVRVTLYVMPSTAFIPRSLDRDTEVHVQIFVPVDDEHTMFYGVFFSQNGEPVRDLRMSLFARRGIELDDNYYRRANEDNGWLQDRPRRPARAGAGSSKASPTKTSRVRNRWVHVDRTAEHPGTSDVAIIRCAWL